MKKTTMKKLSLCRETLRELEENALAHAPGGTGDTFSSTCTSCVCFAPTNVRRTC